MVAIAFLVWACSQANAAARQAGGDVGVVNCGDLPIGVTPLDDERHKRATYLVRRPVITLELGAHMG
jgi:hypothetical protein